MARKPNHVWEKRQRELAKQAKRAAKQQRRQAAKDEKDPEDMGHDEPVSQAGDAADDAQLAPQS